MICYMCGRKISDDAVVCRGCGAQQHHAQRVRRDRLSDTMKGDVTILQKQMKTWQLCVSVFLAVAVLMCAYAVYPTVAAAIKNAIVNSRDKDISPAVAATATEIDKVSGEILVLDSKISDCTIQDEKAYSDGSWEKKFLVNGCITVKTMRYTANEDWINTHIFALYPDVQNVSAITPAPSYSDCSAVRIRFSDTKYAENCTVEVVLIKSEEYDHILIVEMPNDLFDEYLVWIDEWIDSIVLVDADGYNGSQTL